MNAEDGPDSFEFELSEDAAFPSCLLLSSADEAYLALRGWDRGALGGEMESLYNYREAVALSEIYTQLCGRTEELRYFRELAGCVWLVDACRIDRGAHFCGRRVGFPEQFQSEALSCRLGVVPSELVRRAPSETVILRRSGSGFTAASISAGAAEAAGLCRGGDIARIRPFFYGIDPGRAAAACLDTGQCIRYLDMFTRGGRIKHLLLDFFPMAHEANYVAVTIRTLDCGEYYALQLPYTDFSPQLTPIRENAAYAAFEYRGGELMPWRCNKAFRDIAWSEETQAAVYKRLLRPCRELGMLRCGITDMDGRRYFCAAFPSSDGATHLAMLKLDDMDLGFEDYRDRLSPREREISRYILDGLSTRDIAAKLVIADGTVKKTVSNIYSKLGVKSRVELIRLMLHY